MVVGRSSLAALGVPIIRYDHSAPEPDYALAHASILERHNDERVQEILTGEFPVKTRLAKFDNGPWFIFIEPLCGFPHLMLEDHYHGTNCAGTPLHITLHGPDMFDVQSVMQMVHGVRVLSFSRQYGRRRSQTAYVPQGEVLTLCQQLAASFGFHARGEWHISL